MLMNNLFVFSELSRNSSEVSAPFRGGSITPDGLIDEDFEEEIGQPIVSMATI